MNAPDRFELFVLPDGVKKYGITPPAVDDRTLSSLLETDICYLPWFID